MPVGFSHKVYDAQVNATVRGRLIFDPKALEVANTELVGDVDVALFVGLSEQFPNLIGSKASQGCRKHLISERVSFVV